MKNKSEALEKFQKYCAQYGQPGILRSDNGGEYTSKIFEKFCLENGIGREFTIPNTPEQNPVAERSWETLMEMTRALLFEKNLDKKLWVRAIMTAAYIRNRCLTSGTTLNLTPYELFYGEKPDLSNLRVFGSKCIAHNLDLKKKLDPRGKEGIFVGYTDWAHSYVIYLPQENKTILSRTVKFFERNEDISKSSSSDMRYVDHNSSSESEEERPYSTPNRLRRLHLSRKLRRKGKRKERQDLWRLGPDYPLPTRELENRLGKLRKVKNPENLLMREHFSVEKKLFMGYFWRSRESTMIRKLSEKQSEDQILRNGLNPWNRKSNLSMRTALGL